MVYLEAWQISMMKFFYLNMCLELLLFMLSVYNSHGEKDDSNSSI